MAAKKNKRLKAKADGRVFPVPFTAAVVVGVMGALLYVWMCIRCDMLGKEIRKLEMEHEQLRKWALNQVFVRLLSRG